MPTHRRIPWFLRPRPEFARDSRLGPALFVIGGVLSSSACQTQSASGDDGVGQTRQAVEVAADSTAPASSSAAAPASEGVALPIVQPPDVGAGITRVTRLTADGESATAQVPAASPSIEVPEGAPCGVADAAGVMQSCQPGTYCVSEGGTATCVKAPRAPRWDG